MTVAGGATVVEALTLDQVGARAGVNSSRITHNVAEFGRRTGFQLGFMVEWSHSWFSLVPEAEYAQRGFESQVLETDSNGDVIQTVYAVTRLDYLSFPLLAKARYALSPAMPVFILSGPKFEFIVNREPGRFEFTDLTVIDTFSNRFRDYSVSWLVGGGVELPKSLFVEARFSFGLTNLLRDGVRGEAKNRSLEISVGILFR
jgi:hypothetical protein